MKLRYILLLIILVALGYTIAFQQSSKPAEQAYATPEKAKTSTDAVVKTDSPITQEETKETQAPYEISCKYLSEMLGKCEPYSCTMPHPEDKNFSVEHTVLGKLQNGLCVHLQTAPPQLQIVCNYSDGMRILVAKTLRPDTNEKVSEMEGKILSAGFDAECEVYDQTTGEVVRGAAEGNAVVRTIEETSIEGTSQSSPESTDNTITPAKEPAASEKE